MNEQNEKQAIKEMANILEQAKIDAHVTIGSMNYGFGMWYAKACYTAGYRKQSVGEWEWFEEWNPSTPEHPRECDDCGWRCGECKTALADIVGGYWDNPDEKPNLNFCPNCGAKMKGGAE